jgi:hypothetical protein
VLYLPHRLAVAPDLVAVEEEIKLIHLVKNMIQVLIILL